MTRACDACGKRYEAQRSTSKYCSGSCRAAASQSSVSELRARAAASETGLVSALEAELEEAGRLDTALGQQAVVIARMLLGASGSGAAALSKDLRAARAEALRGARIEESRVSEHKDELAARRARGA